LSVLNHKADLQNRLRIQPRVAAYGISPEYRTEVAVCQFVGLPFTGRGCKARLMGVARQPSVLYGSEPEAVGFSIAQNMYGQTVKIGQVHRRLCPGPDRRKSPVILQGHRAAEHGVSVFVHLEPASGDSSHHAVIYNLPSGGRRVAEIDEDLFRIVPVCSGVGDLLPCPKRGKQSDNKQTGCDDGCGGIQGGSAKVSVLNEGSTKTAIRQFAVSGSRFQAASFRTQVSGRRHPSSVESRRAFAPVRLSSRTHPFVPSLLSPSRKLSGFAKRGYFVLANGRSG